MAKIKLNDNSTLHVVETPEEIDKMITDHVYHIIVTMKNGFVDENETIPSVKDKMHVMLGSIVCWY